MRAKLLMAAMAVAVIPVAVSGQVSEIRSSTQRDESSRRVCQVQSRTGSRLGASTRCGTKQEMANVREEQRRTVECVQSNRVSFEQ